MFHNDHLYVAFRPFKFCKGYNEAWIKETNKTQCVYFLVNNNEGAKRTKEDITSVNALFIDIDGTREWNGDDGSVVVGRDATHWHAYWPLVEGESMEKWAIAQKALIKHFQSDKACSDISRVMRVWGSVNHKPDAKGAVYSTWKKDDKKWTIDEVIGFYGLDMSKVYDHDRIEISMDGVTCPPFVRDELKAEIENKEQPDGSRYTAVLHWSRQALGAGMDAREVHDFAESALLRWGYDVDYPEGYAGQQAWNAQSGTIAKIKSGALPIDSRYRPDLDFDGDIEEEPVEDVEAQGEALGCVSVTDELKAIPNDARLDWLKDNVARVAKLGAVDREMIKAEWGTKSSVVDKAVREYLAEARESRDEEEEDWAEIAGRFLVKRGRPLAYIDEEWYSWNGTFYEKVKEVAVKKEVSDFIKKPSQSRVGNAFQQVQFACLASRRGEPEGVPFQNGRLMPSGELVAHSPENGGLYCLPFDYDAKATCPEFLRVMHTQWFNEVDDERPMILRQWYNYLLSGRDDLHKIMLLVGPPRAGKGTNMKIMQAMLGDINFTSPRTKDFLSDFGLQQAVGKRAIFMPDVHLPGGQKAEIAERLKTIAGKDGINIQRKYMSPLENIQLGQIVMGCNYLADVEDESNALVDRFSVIHFTEEYTGKEDTGLKGRLLAELPGIFNWAKSCPDFVHFHEDPRGHDMKKDMSLAANPVRAWAKDNLAACDKGFVFSDDLYASFTKWCEEEEVPIRFAKNAFIRKVKMVFQKADSRNKKVDGKQRKALFGVRTLESCESENEDDSEELF